MSETTTIDQEAARAHRANVISLHRRGVLSQYTEEQQAAALRLYRLVRSHGDTGGGVRAAKVLLSLYNGNRFKVDLTDFRSFDTKNLTAALTVLHMDASRCYAEIHVILDAILGEGSDTGAEFEHWAYNLRMSGRCKKEQLPALPNPLPAFERL